MTIPRLVVTGAALLIAGGCADSGSILDPTPPAVSVQHSSDLSESRARRIQASGEFDALVDFSTLTATPRGGNCLLEVSGQLVFTGTIEGAATGRTSALVFAPCSEVTTNPPGTFPDVFRSELAFEGTVDGQPEAANVLYLGRVQPGGQIAGRLVLFNGVEGVLDVLAQVAVGGEYSGSLVTR